MKPLFRPFSHCLPASKIRPFVTRRLRRKGLTERRMIDRRQAYDSATLGLSQAKANRGLGGSLVGARRVMPFLGLDAHGVIPNRQLEGCVSKNKTAISLSHSLSFQSRADRKSTRLNSSHLG